VKQISLVFAIVALTCAACGGNDVTMSTTTTTAAGPPPTVASINPTSGKTVGGTAVTVTGSNFASGASLTLGGVAATGVTVAAGGASLTATTGARSTTGPVEVVVRNPDGQSSTLGNGFQYVLVKANPGGPYAIEANRNITMSGVTSASTLQIAHFFWNCGQPDHGKQCEQDTPTPVFEYKKEGKLGTERTYTVTLTIEDTIGNRDTATTTVLVTQAYE
jgi:IPT/TIG domain